MNNRHGEKKKKKESFVFVSVCFFVVVVEEKARRFSRGNRIQKRTKRESKKKILKKERVFYPISSSSHRDRLFIIFEVKKSIRTWSFDSIENDRLTADGLERSDRGVDASRQQVLRFLEDLLGVVGFKSRLGDGDDFLLVATLSGSGSDGGGRNRKLRGNNVVRGNGKHVCL
jgi:hypothetical protein